MNDADIAEAAEAWRRHVRSVTDDEVAALLPLVAAGHGHLRSLVEAYRAGRQSVPRPAKEHCPTCRLCLCLGDCTDYVSGMETGTQATRGRRGRRRPA